MNIPEAVLMITVTGGVVLFLVWLSKEFIE